MDSLTGAALRSVTWLVQLPDGSVVAACTSGQSAVGALAPSLDELRRRLAAEGGPVPATWTPSEGSPLPLLVVAVPGLEGVLGLAPEVLDGQVGHTVENLVNQVAHDVRNFAFAIGLQAELGQRRAATPDVKGHFAAVLRQVDLLKAFLEKLLLFGRPARLEPTATSLDALARDVVRRLQFGRDPAAAPVSVTVAIGDDVTGLRWDQAAIGRVIEELLDNAFRSAEPPPSVDLRAAIDGDRVILAVSDTGRGIPPDTLAKLSIPMLVRRPGGTGLGLAIARKIAAAHGGELTVATTSSGTTVTLSLPRVVPAG